MPATRLARWISLLEAAIISVMLFSAMMVLLPAQTQLLFNFVAFGRLTYPETIPPAAQPYIVFVYRVLGAVMFGWMLALLAIARGPLRRSEPWSWWTLAVSIGGWFAIDTAASLLTGYPGNALLNLGFLTALALPLAAIRGIARGVQL